MIKTLDIEPTTICKLNCPFCFGPIIESQETELDLGIWQNALLRFKNKGVENIVISGGEPLLYKEIVELVRYLHELKYRVIISTNGRDKQSIFEIAPYCDWVSLPIDGVDKSIRQIMRTDDYPLFEIFATCYELKRRSPNLKIKIGTVVTQLNIHEIIQIGSILLSNLSCFDVWKIYQYTPRRKQKHNYEKLQVSDKSFEELSLLVKQQFSNNMKIVFSSNESRRNAYTFIYHNGDVNLVNIGNSFEDVFLGNITDFSNINFKLANTLLNSNHYFNHNNTYYDENA